VTSPTTWKTRVEAKFGAASVWMLNPGEKQWSLPGPGQRQGERRRLHADVDPGSRRRDRRTDRISISSTSPEPDDFRRALKLTDTDLMGPARSRIRPGAP